MTLSYLQSSLDKLDDANRDDVIEICINPDGTCWGEFQGDHSMQRLGQTLSGTELRDLGNQIASGANTTLSKDKPIVSVSITYRARPLRSTRSSCSTSMAKSASSRRSGRTRTGPCGKLLRQVTSMPPSAFALRTSST